MDLYMKEFERVVSDNNFILQVSNEKHDGNAGNIIILRPDLYESCPSKLELSNALMKRLQKPGTSYTTAQICATAICCICSQSYTVSHTKMRNISERTMASIWSHLEILKVSSSYNLQKWMRSCLGSRTQLGYTLHHRDMHSSNETNIHNTILRRPARKALNTQPEFINNIFVERTFGNINSVRDAMATDMRMLSALRFMENTDPPTFRPYYHSEVLD